MLNTITTIVNAKPTVWKLQKLAETVLVFYNHRPNNNKCYTVYVYSSYVHSIYDSCGHRCYDPYSHNKQDPCLNSHYHLYFHDNIDKYGHKDYDSNSNRQLLYISVINLSSIFGFFNVTGFALLFSFKIPSHFCHVADVSRCVKLSQVRNALSLTIT